MPRDKRPTSARPTTPVPHAPALRAAGRPKDPAKRHAIVCAAGELFLERGYGNASMEAIAQAAQVSKLTLYSHFADKAALFREVVRERVEHFTGAETIGRAMRAETVHARLEALAEGFMNLILSDDATRLERLLVAEAATQPDACAMFFEAGPQRVLTDFTRIFEGLQQEGLVTNEIAPPKLAEFFTSLLKGKIHVRVMLGQSAGARKELRDHAAECVVFFLRAVGTKKARASEASAR
jgi:TetR/AcrR family transcriptional repressor of mexJK operon